MCANETHCFVIASFFGADISTQINCETTLVLKKRYVKDNDSIYDPFKRGNHQTSQDTIWQYFAHNMILLWFLVSFNNTCNLSSLKKKKKVNNVLKVKLSVSVLFNNKLWHFFFFFFSISFFWGVQSEINQSHQHCY